MKLNVQFMFYLGNHSGGIKTMPGEVKPCVFTVLRTAGEQPEKGKPPSHSSMALKELL